MTATVDDRAYLPSLDGVRALAVVAVLFFHQGWGFASGGYLGVSLFFTLSGFLIASLLLRERASSGRISLVGFWTRRARRLLPPALVAVVAAWVAMLFADLGPVEQVRGDAVSAITYTANWHFLAEGQSYGALFTTPSPLLHFWSLAIEEQFYVVIAPLFALVGRSRRALVAAVTLLCAAGVVANVAWGAAGESDHVYYDTASRMPELLAGVLAAFAWHRVAFGERTIGRAARIAVDACALAAIATLTVLTVVLTPTSDALERGVLPLVALCSTALVLAAAAPSTLVSRALGAGPLPLVGRLSYSIYLFHWPVFLVADSDRTGLDGAALFAVRVAITLVFATASYALLERPARSRVHTGRRALAVFAPATAVALVVVALVQPPASEQIDFESARQEYEDIIDRPAPEAPETPVMAIYGDSTAMMTGWGLASWVEQTDAFAMTGGVVELGCGLGRGGMRFTVGEPSAVPARCDWSVNWPRDLEMHPAIDVAVLQIGPWDVANRMLPGEEVWRAPGDPVYDRYLLGEMLEAIDMFHAHDVGVVWLTSPKVELSRLDDPPPSAPIPTNEPARIDRLNELIRAAAERRPGVAVVDLAGYLAQLPGGELSARLRPDGVHFTQESAVEVAAWLGPELVAAAASMNPLSRGASLRSPSPG